MLFDRLIRERLAREEGYTLVELLVVILILGLVLGAVIKLSVTGQKAAARDRERNIAVERGNAFLFRMTNELRQATQIHLADTSCPAGTTPSNCIDVNLENRTIVARNSAGTVTGVTKSSRRIRINCQTGTCFRAVSTNVSTAPSATVQQQFVQKVTNATVTAPGGATPPIFDYKAWIVPASGTPGWASKTLAFSSPSISGAPPNWVNVTLIFSRAGARNTANGLKGTIDLQDAADFKNLNVETSPCSPQAVAQANC